MSSINGAIFLPGFDMIGVCEGVSRMGMHAFFCGKYDIFLRRIIYLNTVSINQLLKELERIKKKQKSTESLTDLETFILEMPAFFDGVAAFQNPDALMSGDISFLTNTWVNTQDGFFRHCSCSSTNTY